MYMRLRVVICNSKNENISSCNNKLHLKQTVKSRKNLFQSAAAKTISQHTCINNFIPACSSKFPTSCFFIQVFKNRYRKTLGQYMRNEQKNLVQYTKPIMCKVLFLALARDTIQFLIRLSMLTIEWLCKTSSLENCCLF